MGDFQQSRIHMVDNQLRTNDVTDHRILDAMEEMPRERFVPVARKGLAYIDQDMMVSDVGGGRFLLKPHVLAKLLQLANIRADDVALVVGCATGYSVAVMSRLAGSVVGVESDSGFVETASEELVELGIDNAAVIDGALTEGCAAEGPFDVILFDGAVDFVPEKLTAQLKDGGRLVVIEGSGAAGAARLYVRSGDSVAGRFAFNASAQVLPGFQREAIFEF